MQAPSSESSNCCGLIKGRDLEEICGVQKIHPLITDVNCTCADYLYCRLAVVTAISSNHFNEAQDLIRSVQINVPKTKIYVYDLGLTESQRRTLSDYCFVKVRTFPFNKYPPHIRNLDNSDAWKPIVINDVAEEYDVILYGDASLRINKPLKNNVIPYLIDFPFVAAPVAAHSVIAVTPPEMYNYLGLNLTRMQALKAMPREFQSTMMCVWVNRLMREKFLNYWVDCALHQQCMAPKGYKRHLCSMKGKRFMKAANYGGEFAGCMRSQSVVNIILYREFGSEIWKKIQRKLGNAWSIHRYVTQLFTSTMWCPRKISQG